MQHEDTASEHSEVPEEEQQAPTKKRRHVIKNRLELPDSDKDNLAEWYEAHPCFYNKKDPKYRVPAFKQRLMIDKAAELTLKHHRDITYDAVYQWFRDMRTQLVKDNKQLKSGAAAKESFGRDQLQKRFGFLHQHTLIFAKRRTLGLAPLESESDQDPTDDEDPAAELPEEDAAPEGAATAVTGVPTTTTSTSSAPPRGGCRVRGGRGGQQAPRGIRVRPRPQGTSSMQDKLETAILNIATNQHTMTDIRRQVDRVVEASHAMLDQSRDIRHTWTQ